MLLEIALLLNITVRGHVWLGGTLLLMLLDRVVDPNYPNSNLEKNSDSIRKNPDPQPTQLKPDKDPEYI